ncbi:hypothetical protein F2Q69_00040117 [Brassica cretica]|uniref:Uncharacterized protein n=1 Tax=Brassica cretica TaxID=69181 RepID=A0A8S9N9A9_BRACR|nr:hypothetical protein F2Q69_00040117 [Brassica cretica]
MRVPLPARMPDAFGDITTRGEARGVALVPPPASTGPNPLRQQVLTAKKREGKQVATVESVDAGGRRSAPPKRSKEPKGKGVVLPQEEENENITEEEQAPHKKAKVSKGKKVDTERDRTKTPTEDELCEHLKNGVLWPPTRFADIKIMEKLEIDHCLPSQMIEIKCPFVRIHFACVCVNQCESWLKELVDDEYCNLSRGKRIRNLASSESVLHSYVLIRWWSILWSNWKCLEALWLKRRWKMKLVPDQTISTLVKPARVHSPASPSREDAT